MLTYFYNGTNCSVETQRSLKQIIWNNLTTPGGLNLTFACNQVILTECQVIDMVPKPPRPFLFSKNLTTMTTAAPPEPEEATTTTVYNATYTTSSSGPEETEDLPLNHYVSTSCFAATEEQGSLNRLEKKDRPDFANITQLLANQSYLVISTYLDAKCKIEYRTIYLIADGSCSHFPGENSTVIRFDGIHASVRKYRNQECKGRPYEIKKYDTSPSACVYQGYDKLLLSDTYSFSGFYHDGIEYLEYLEERAIALKMGLEKSAASFSGRGKRSFPWLSIIAPAISIMFLF